MITSRVKFLERSRFSYSRGARAVATSGGSSADNILSENKNNNWESDRAGNIETITINLNSSDLVDRIILRDHNFKNFSIATSSPLRNIQDINKTTLNTINVTDNTLDTSYFSFTPQRIRTIILTINEAIDDTQRKQLFELIATTEIATFKGFPEIKTFPFILNETKTKAKDGRLFVNKQNKTLSNVSLNFKNYFEIGDINLASELNERNEPFVCWFSGGYQNFRFEVEGFRLRDFYTMISTGKFKTGLKGGSYSGLMQAQLRLSESL